MMNRSAERMTAPGCWRTALVVAIVATMVGTAMAQATGQRADVPTIKVGDRWKSERHDRRTGAKENEFVRTVTAVTASKIEGTENDDKLALTSDMNLIETSAAVFSGDVKHLNFPLEVGKKWSFKYDVTNKVNGGKSRWQLDASVVAYEKVKVPAGEFDAFKIEYRGFWNNDRINRSGRVIQTSWFAPAARANVKAEFDDCRE